MNITALYVALPFVLVGAVIARNWLRELFLKATRAAALVEPRTCVLQNAAGAAPAPETYRVLPFPQQRRVSSFCEWCIKPASDVGPIFITPVRFDSGAMADFDLCASCRAANGRGELHVFIDEDLSEFEISAKVLPFPSQESRERRQGLVS